ncbi:ADAMTS-like protein 5 [Petromyzon marinus]|uniref:ADAMTS-like protein 5 n=1 Tax=Petromyzon marinus TaxID=7757 RepID=UPI003F72AD18
MTWQCTGDVGVAIGAAMPALWILLSFCVFSGEAGSRPAALLSRPKRQALSVGEWGPWSAWSPCSLSCGGGVTLRSRRCASRFPDTEPCQGDERQYQACNMVVECPQGSVDFREMQCTLYNDRPIRGHGGIFQWTPFHGAINQCELNCLATGQNFYYNFGRVLDGTRCGMDLGQLCVNGQCLTAGCDLILGSGAKEDACRVCGGHNETCQHFRSIFMSSHPSTGHFGYSEVATIPAGATHIRVSDNSRNYLALMNGHRRYVINGNWVIDWPGEYVVTGTKVLYKRSADKQETMEAAGPTGEDLHVMVLFREQNPGIEYEYWLPSERHSRIQETQRALLDAGWPADLLPWPPVISTTPPTTTTTATTTTTTPYRPRFPHGWPGFWPHQQPHQQPQQQSHPPDQQQPHHQLHHHYPHSQPHHSQPHHHPHQPHQQSQLQMHQPHQQHQQQQPHHQHEQPRHHPHEPHQQSQVQMHQPYQQPQQPPPHHKPLHHEQHHEQSHQPQQPPPERQRYGAPPAHGQQRPHASAVASYGDHRQHQQQHQQQTPNRVPQSGQQGHGAAGPRDAASPPRHDVQNSVQQRYEPPRSVLRPRLPPPPPPEYCSRCKKVRGRSNRIKQFCEKDFVFRGKVLGKKTMGLETRYEVQVTRTYKSDFPLTTREYVWVPNVCECPRVLEHREYVFMARRHVNFERTLNRILLEHDSFLRLFRPEETRLMKGLADLCRKRKLNPGAAG